MGSAPYLGQLSLNLLQGLASYLEAETGARVQHESNVSYDRFAVLAAMGRFDLLLVPAHLGHVLIRDYGFEPLVGTTEKFRAVVITRSSSQIKELAELRGTEMATPGGPSTTTVVLRSHLRDQGIDAELRALPSHPDVVLAVIRNEFESGVVSDRVLENLRPDLMSSLRILWRGPPITRGAFIASPRQSPDEVASLRKLLFGWLETASGREPFAPFLKRFEFTPLRAEDLASLEAYSAELRELLRSSGVPAAPR